MNVLAIGSLAVTVSAVLAGSAVQSGKLPEKEAAAIKAITKDRADTETWLRSDPSSYLAAIDRRDFGAGKTLTVGRAADNDIRLDDGALAPHHLRATVQGDKFLVSAVDAPARFGVSGKLERTASLGPSSIEVGRFHLRLSHQGFPAIIVFDPKSPHFKDYKGLKYFPIDLADRYELRLTPSPRPDIIVVQSTRGNERRAQRIGWFDFTVGGTHCRLEAVRLLEPGVGENDISVFFRDATTGHESYSVGRYVDAEKQATGAYLLDFNLAYNPACAISEYYNCPIPSQANTLGVAVRAGEMDSHYH